MVFKQYLLKLSIFLSVLILIGAGDFDDEKGLIKAADKHFDNKEFLDATPMYAQLVTSYPQNPTYNYKYGTCLLFSSEDKTDAVKYLKYAVDKNEEDRLALFYLARAYHLNYEFENALKYYQLFKKELKEKEYSEFQIQDYINQCTSGRRLIKNIKQINVVEKKNMQQIDFFRAYRLGSMERKILVNPEQFQTKLDKKNNYQSLIVHNPQNNEIYFSSYGDKGENGTDIFKVVKFPDGSFSEPVNLGPFINTTTDEAFPYLHPNGNTLYFASKGHNSIGGFDIFKSELDSFTNLWGKAENVGFAINSPDDDILFISDLNENVAYFSSSRMNKDGTVTVFKILPNNSQDVFIFLKGEVDIIGETSKAANIEIINNSNGEVVGEFKSKPNTGSFFTSLSENESYTINITVPGKPKTSTVLEMPDKREARAISRKFIVQNDANQTVSIIDDEESVDSDQKVMALLKNAANLEVSINSPVTFNDPTSVPKKVAIPKPKEEAVTINDTPTDNLTNTETTEQGMIASAQKDLEQVKIEKAKIKKEMEAAYFVANKKNVKSDMLKTEINQLTSKYELEYNEEAKAALKVKLDQKQEELSENTKGALASLTMAKAKERLLEKKIKEVELSQAYLNAIKSAESSGNSSSAIAELQKYSDELTSIQKEIREMDSEPGNEFGAEINNKKAQKSIAEAKLQQTDYEIIEMEKKYGDLLSQANSSTNQALKDELILQSTELQNDIKKKNAQRAQQQIKINQLTEEMELLANSDEILNEIRTEANDENFVATFSESQKNALSSSIKEPEKEKEIPIAITKDEVEPKSNNSEIDKQKEEQAISKINIEKAAIEEEKSNLANIKKEKEILTSKLSNAKNDSEKETIKNQISDLQSAEQLSISNINNSVNEINSTLSESNLSDVQTKELNNEIASINNEVQTIKEESNKENIAIESALTKTFNNTEATDNSETKVENNNDEIVNWTEEFNTTTPSQTDIDAVISNLEINPKDYDSNPNYAEIKNQINDIAKYNSLSKKATGNKKKEIEKKLEEENKALLINITKLKSDEWTSKDEKLISDKDESDKKILLSESLKTSEITKLQEERDALLKQAQEQKTLATNTSDLNEKNRIISKALSLQKQANIKQESLITSINKVNQIAQNEKTDTEDNLGLSPEEEAFINGSNDELQNESTIDKQSNNEISITQSNNSTANNTKANQAKQENQNTAVQKQKELVEQTNDYFGSSIESDFNYGRSPDVVIALKEAKKTENEAVQLFRAADSLKTLAQENPNKAKKYNKEADKKIEKAQDLQEDIQTNYGEVNKKEIDNYQNQIKYNIDNEYIAKEYIDSAKTIMDNAKSNLKKAEKLRVKAKEEKNFTQKQNLYNEAYQLEIEAIKQQNIVINGELDENTEEEISYVVRTREIVTNEYTEKADELKERAKYTDDEGERLKLLSLARKYELAADENRNNRIINDAKEKKGAYEQRLDFISVAKEQSGFNKLANDAYQIEMKSDSIYQLANKKLKLADDENDLVTKIDLTEEASRLYTEAKSAQNDAIKKYQESKANPDEDGIKLAFKTKKDNPVTEEQTAIADNINSNITNSDNNNNNNNNTDLTDQNKSVSDIATNNINTENKENPEENTTQNNSTEQTVVTLPAEKESTTVEANIAYTTNIEEAKAIEAREEKRVGEIAEIKKEAESKKDKSEEILKGIENLTDITQIEKQLAEAEKYREEAEALDIKAKKEEAYLKNNLAEAKSKRREAELIKEALAEEDNNNVKVDDYVKNNPSEVPVNTDNNNNNTNNNLANNQNQEVNTETSTNTTTNKTDDNNLAIESNTKKETEFTSAELQAETTKSSPLPNSIASSEIDWTNIAILGKGDTKDQVIKDGLEVNGTTKYTKDSKIEIDPQLPNGLIFKVQVGAFKNKIDPTVFNGIAPITGETTSFGFIRYTAGLFRGFKSADMAKGRIRNIGFKDAFVVAFYNGKRITMEEADRIIETVNESEKFVYENIVEDEVQKLKSIGITEEEANSVGQISQRESVVVNNNSNNIASNTVNSNATGNNTTRNNTNISNTPVEAISLNTRNDVYYTVQIGAFSSPKSSTELYNISPIYSYTTSNGYIRYSTGVFKKYADAELRKLEVRASGPKDAFVTAYKGNDKISIDDAKSELQDTNESNNTNQNSESGQNSGNNSTTAKIEFKVQVGAYNRPIDVNSTPLIKDITQYGIGFITRPNGFVVYSVGSFNNKTDADNLKNIVRGVGIADAFVVAYKDGVRITVKEALELLGN